MGLVKPWLSLFIDRRGSLFIPMDIKRHLGVEAVEALAVRVLGSALILVPAARTLTWPLEDAGRDQQLAALLNEAWEGKVPTLTPSPFQAPFREPLVRYEIPEVGPTQTLDLEQMVYVNKKGFIQIPEEFKKLLGMRIGDPFMVQLKQQQGKPVLIILPVDHTVSISGYLHKKQQQHVREAALAERRALLAAEVAQLEARVQMLTMQKKELVQEINKTKEETL